MRHVPKPPLFAVLFCTDAVRNGSRVVVYDQSIPLPVRAKWPVGGFALSPSPHRPDSPSLVRGLLAAEGRHLRRRSSKSSSEAAERIERVSAEVGAGDAGAASDAAAPSS
jgi:hypothetical protein